MGFKWANACPLLTAYTARPIPADFTSAPYAAGKVMASRPAGSRTRGRERAAQVNIAMDLVANYLGCAGAVETAAAVAVAAAVLVEESRTTKDVVAAGMPGDYLEACTKR